MMKLRHREPNLIQVSQLLSGRAKSETKAVQLQDLALNHCPELVRLSEPEGTTEGNPLQSPHFTDIQRWDVNNLQVFPTQLLRVRQLKSMCHLGRQKTLENGGDYGQLGGYMPPSVLTLSFMGVDSQYYHSLGLDSTYETPVCRALELYNHPVMCTKPVLDSSHHQ